jgi:hypothetical protein
VERSLAWLGRNCRFSQDYDMVQTSETMIGIAAIRIMLNRLAPACYFSPILSASVLNTLPFSSSDFKPVVILHVGREPRSRLDRR